MKKIITLSLCILAFTYANSQEEMDVYKQSSGDNNFELQFDPGAIFNASKDTSIISNGVGISYRKFISESSAFRANVNISYVKIEDDSGVDISLKPGYEKHFKGTKRLSPYMGAEFIIGFSNIYAYDVLTVGIVGIAGFDYYIAKKLYLGLELNYGLYYIKVD